jgi:hypothetical protein
VSWKISSSTCSESSSAIFIIGISADGGVGGGFDGDTDVKQEGPSIC